jgi:hypothetical protein
MKLRRRAAVGLAITPAVLWSTAGTAAAATYTPLPAHVAWVCRV